MQTVYQLAHDLQIEYEWDRGPRPSGYAYLKFTARPESSNLHGTAQIIELPEMRWQMRSERGNQGLEYQDARENWGKYIDVLIERIHQGVEQALAGSLDKPVVDVTVLLEEAIVDEVYST